MGEWKQGVGHAVVWVKVELQYIAGSRVNNLLPCS